MARHTKTKQVVSAVSQPASTGLTVKVNITFSMSDQNKIDISLNGDVVSTITESKTTVLQNLSGDDTISIDGVGEGDTTIKIDKQTSPATPETFKAGPIHRNYNMI